MKWDAQKLRELEKSLTPVPEMKFIGEILPLWHEAAADLPRFVRALDEINKLVWKAKTVQVRTRGCIDEQATETARDMALDEALTAINSVLKGE